MGDMWDETDEDASPICDACGVSARGLGWADGSTVLNRYFETAIEDSPNLGL